MAQSHYCKVLIVDDELLIRKGIKHSIDWEKEGFQIIDEATNGEEALASIENDQPHIVITDMVMPVMDGEMLTKAIKNQYPEIEIIVLSSFGEFEYVRNTFQLGIADYILKTELEGTSLLTVLKETAKKIPGLVLREKNDAATVNSIEEIMRRVMGGNENEADVAYADEYFSHPYYCLLGLSFRNENDTLVEKIEEQLKHKFTNIHLERLPKKQNISAFLFNFERGQMQAIKESIKMIATSLTFADEQIVWGLAAPFEDFIQIKQSYENGIMKLLNYHFYLEGQKIFIYDALPNLSNVTASFQLAEFTELFQRRQSEEAFAYIETYTKKLKQQYTEDEFTFKSSLGNIVFNIVILLGNMGYDHKRLDSEKYQYIAKIEEGKSATSTVEIMTQFLQEAKAIVERVEEKSNHSKMQKLLNYIDRNYAEPLTLSEMGEKFHYNPSYLSKYFSDNHHQGFSEYLNQVRLKKSMELLKEGQEPIAKISMRVGYSDHSYFCRVFKNFTGLSPSSYRRKHGV